MAGETRPNMTVILADLAEVKADVARHDAFINGNGQPGVKVRLATLETQLAQLSKDIGDIKRQLSDMTRAAWGLVATIGGSVLLYLLTKVLPDVIAHFGKGIP